MIPLPRIYNAERAGRGLWVVDFISVEPVRRRAFVGKAEPVHLATGRPLGVSRRPGVMLRPAMATDPVHDLLAQYADPNRPPGCGECHRRPVPSRLVPGEWIETHGGGCSQNSALQVCKRCGYRHVDRDFGQVLACVMGVSIEEGREMQERIVRRAQMSDVEVGREAGLRPEDLLPMTPEQIAWARAQRTDGLDPENVEPELCRVPSARPGTCAYAGPDGADACGVKCLWTGAR